MSRVGRQLAAAVAATVLLVAVGRVLGESDPASRRALRDFDAVWRSYDRLYPYFDVKGVDWDAQRAHLRPLAARARTEEDGTSVLVQLLAPLRDVHATLVRPDGSVVRPTPPPPPSNWSAEGWRAEVAGLDWRQPGPAWGWARVDDVGYLAVANWDPAQWAPADVDGALAALRDVDALVVDVRMNGGGEDGLALALAGRFTDRPVLAQTVRTRDGGRNEFGPPVARRVAPAGPDAFLAPVVVLMGRGSVSSTETFAVAMGALDHVILAGDTTGAASGHPVERRLSGGWRFTVPRLRARSADGRMVEGDGVVPDVLLPIDPGDAVRGDPVLRAALALAAGRRPAHGAR